MSAYISTTIAIKDPVKFAEYSEKARALIAEAEIESVLVARVEGTLTGSAGHQFEAVFRFPDAETAKAWYASPEYQALIPMRDAGADVVFKLLTDL